MKRKIFILLLAAILLFAACGSSADSMQQVTIDVNGMFCMSCEGRLTGALEEAGVTVLDISAAEDFVEVEFDSDEISLDEIQEIILAQGLEL